MKAALSSEALSRLGIHGLIHPYPPDFLPIPDFWVRTQLMIRVPPVPNNGGARGERRPLLILLPHYWGRGDSSLSPWPTRGSDGGRRRQRVLRGDPAGLSRLVIERIDFAVAFTLEINAAIRA
jgi:hypothetical protein